MFITNVLKRDSYWVHLAYKNYSKSTHVFNKKQNFIQKVNGLYKYIYIYIYNKKIKQP
uniref:Uncharacterized protein n=1 Tax=Megaviridae environmental sample TaxID=1737588 RepID=A0A5J6VLN2_9VIRU|nr:MAG: hypothetical protein [Megaviridae environmental sample]